MPFVQISNLGTLGLITDRREHELPPEAWTSGENVRFLNGYVQRCSGEVNIMGTPTNSPIWLLPFFNTTTAWWIYAGTTNVFATDGTNHYDLAGVDAPYAATLDLNWTGGILNTIPILNNPVDGPYYIPGPDPSTQNLTILPNWTYGTVTAMTCRALRPFKNYLVAYDVSKTVGGVLTRYPQLVKWSHAADPGSLPISWDEADTRYDTGEFPLADTNGIVVDALPMRDLNVIYKEDSTYLMQYVGGAFIFRFARAFSTIGTLGRNCAAQLPSGEHVVLGFDDIVLHNGTTARSLLDKRRRKDLFSRLDPTYYNRSFVALNARSREVWVCFPEVGATLPSLAYVWSWLDNTWGIRTLNSPAFAQSGVVAVAGLSTTWDSDSATWTSDGTSWDSLTFNPTDQKLVGAHPNTSRLVQYDVGSDWNGTAYTAKIERTGLGVPFHVNQPPDITSMKFMRAVWPRIDGTTGGRVQISVGAQVNAASPVVWQAPAQDFYIGMNQKIDCRISGRLMAVRFEAPSEVDWRLHGFDLDIDLIGKH